MSATATSLGVPLPATNNLARLMSAGLHYTDPRFTRGVLALKTARPGAGTAKVLAIFGRPAPQPVDCPDPQAAGFYMLAEDDLPEDVRAALQSAVAIHAADLDWQQTADRLHLWLLKSRQTGDGVTVDAAIFLISLVLRRINGPTIACLPQAYLLGLSLHPAWRSAAHSWLADYTPWVKDYLVTRSMFSRVANMARTEALADLPEFMSLNTKPADCD